MKNLSSRPMCARCMKPVDRFVEDERPFLGVVRFIAYCHGERECVDLMTSEVGQSIHFGRAFEPTNLLPPS